MKNNYHFFISDRAKRMLGEHIRFMAQVSKEAASKNKKQILDGIRSLEQMPERFSFLNEPYILPNKYHKMFIENWYLVLFQIKDGNVFVDYILDCRKDYSWLIR